MNKCIPKRMLFIINTSKMDKLTKEQRHKNMQAIKNKGTKDEVLLAKALWKTGLRYRKNDRTVFGNPDLTFKKHKIAIFIDSEFFHGKDWKTAKYEIKSNRDFWWPKIERNIQRDNTVNQALKDADWKVIRFWSREMRKDIPNCIKIIENAIQKSKSNNLETKQLK